MKWSARLKHEDIEICGTKISRKSKEGVHSVLSIGALIDIPLENGVYNWCLRVDLMAMYIGVGICLENAVFKTRFVKGNWCDLGHEHYVAWEDGLTFSHSDCHLNEKKGKIRFKTGDVVNLSYDTRNKLLTISKPDASIELWVASPPAGQNYRPCVYMNSLGEGVSLVSFGIQP
jgi:hypothetical protein